MSKKNKGDFFWIGYADLMTTLFFVMLVLFVLTVIHLKMGQVRLELEREEIITKVENLQKIVRLEEQFKPLEEDGAFIYLPECKKFVAKSLRGKEIFEPKGTIILPEYIMATVEVGLSIESFLNKLQEDKKDFSYLLVIEGNMANSDDRRYDKDDLDGYKLSYERALAVYNLWQENDINFRNDNVEVLISGSGFNGLCREERATGNYEKTEDVEAYNKRFSIQIMPKVTNKYD